MLNRLPFTRPATRTGVRAIQYRFHHNARRHGVRNLAVCRASTRDPPPLLSQPLPLDVWLHEQGGSVTGVEFNSHTVNGRVCRELVASQDLEDGQLVISVPRNCQVRYDDATAPRLLQLFERVPPGSDSQKGSWQFKQALMLLWHLSQPESYPLLHYINHLPGRAEGVATPRVGMLMPDSIVAELQYGPLAEDITNQKYWLETFHEQELAPLLNSANDPFNGMKISRELFSWALAVTTSRSFGLRRGDAHSMPALIDMADHGPDNTFNAKIHSDDDGTMNMYTTKSVCKGECLILNYGPHESRSLILSYGFVLSPPGCNTRDKFWIEFVLESMMDIMETYGGARRASLSTWQTDLLQQMGLIPPSSQQAEVGGAQSSEPFPERVSVYLGRDPAQVIDPRLLAAVRILLLGDESASLVKSLSLDDLGDWRKPIARQHEMVVLKALTGLCAAIYRGFPSTIQEDRTALQALRLLVSKMPADWVAADGGGAVLAVELRLSLKLVLESCLLLVQARAKELQGLEQA